MNVVDTSGWLAYLADEPNASTFEKVLAKVDELLVPSICVFEAVRWSLRERGGDESLDVMALLRSGRVVNLDEPIAIWAASLSVQYKLATADSIVYATAISQDAMLWTQDAHFQGLPSVRYIPKR